MSSDASRMRSFLRLSAFVTVAAVTSVTANAQLIRAPLNDGFVRTSSVSVSVDEMLGFRKQRTTDEPIYGPGYPALWIGEIQYKPVRYVRMTVTDPVTGEQSRELVWYMIYRVIPRDPTEIAGDKRGELLLKLEDPTRDPQNTLDSLSFGSIQTPRFTLKVDDAGSNASYLDEVNLEAQRQILMREYGDRNIRLLNSAAGITEVPVPVSVNDPAPLDSALYGVAVWRNVDPDTDYFTITMRGFSNAYRITETADGISLAEKVVTQKFGRPGDRYLQDEREFRVLNEPSWSYESINAGLDVPEMETVLRNAR